MKTLRERLAEDGLVRVAGMGRLLHHNFVQIVSMMGGYHGLWFDLEHVGNTIESIEIATLAARSHGVDSFCRIAPTDYALVTRCLEAGASGVMAAQIRSPEEAEEFVQWTKFFPRGRRGLNLGGYDAGFGSLSVPEFFEKSNRESLVLIQIETAEAVEACDEIAAIDGVDLLFVGPSDLSQALGVPGDFLHEKCRQAVDAVAAACRKHGKHFGAVTAGPEHARMLVEKGLKMISPTSDVKMLAAGLRAVKEQYAEYF